MTTSKSIRSYYQLNLFLIILLFVVCTKDKEEENNSSTLQDANEKNTNLITENSPPLECDTSSDYPSLGTGSPQSCDEIQNPQNKGTLDCRTDPSLGGYTNESNGWGSYKIIGGTIRYNETKTRVERFFKTITHGNNKKTVLTGKFKISDLSDGNTCIIQSHAGGEILQGEETGSTNRSAQFLLYASKANNNAIRLETHVTENPYTTDTGGSRNVEEFKFIEYGQVYDFVYETGYTTKGIAFSKIIVGNTERYISHSHTTERVYTRYGAYGTSDSNDITAQIEFKDVNLCRN
ncbi:MAG: hypothetical protein ABF273_03595 [Wenyingzhuangia sp.]|uniref:hypothetical protein n=1 Tax=Wenyingzhuangia sp. TaxID=1964193 RepID=UPI00321925F2